MKLKINEHIKGLYEIEPFVHKDYRGVFVKTFNSKVFKELNLETEFKEEYYSLSFKNVLRGMHFQIPPHDHIKMVYCVYGRVLDVVLDLRHSSPYFGRTVSVELSQEKANLLYIPSGFAHGFYVLSETAIMIYKTSTLYNPECDTGILWRSIGFKWPENAPIVSERDSKFLSLKDVMVKNYF